MLLQRLRSAEPSFEAAIAYNLVDLALDAPENSFVDIVRVFSAINRSANPDDPRFSNNMVRAQFDQNASPIQTFIGFSRSDTPSSRASSSTGIL